MKKPSEFLAVAAIAVSLTSCQLATPTDPSLTRIAGVSVVDVETGGLIADQDVFLREHTITWIGPSGTSDLPPPGHTISGEGLYLTPGLWDSHVHVFSVEGEPDYALPLYILNGVTSIRDMGALISLEQQIAINQEISNEERIGPRIINAGAMIDGPPGSWPGQMIAANPQEGRARVREAHALGWTSVKSYSLLNLQTYQAIADEAGELNLPLYGHVPEGVLLSEAIEAGHDVIEHFGRVTKACSAQEAEMIDGARQALTSEDPFPALMAEMAAHSFTTFETWDEATCEYALRSIANAGIAIAPTLIVADFYLGHDPSPEDPRMLTVPLAVREQWGEPDFRRSAMTEDLLALAPEAVKQDWHTFQRAHDAGIVILASSDAAFLNPFLFHGASLIGELERYVEIGLTPREALVTATINPAHLFGEVGETGKVEVGQRADLLLVRANPLENISALRQVEFVIANGRIFDRSALDDLEISLRRRAGSDDQVK